MAASGPPPSDEEKKEEKKAASATTATTAATLSAVRAASAIKKKPDKYPQYEAFEQNPYDPMLIFPNLFSTIKTGEVSEILAVLGDIEATQLAQILSYRDETQILSDPKKKKQLIYDLFVKDIDQNPQLNDTQKQSLKDILDYTRYLYSQFQSNAEPLIRHANPVKLLDFLEKTLIVGRKTIKGIAKWRELLDRLSVLGRFSHLSSLDELSKEEFKKDVPSYTYTNTTRDRIRALEALAEIHHSQLSNPYMTYECQKVAAAISSPDNLSPSLNFSLAEMFSFPFRTEDTKRKPHTELCRLHRLMHLHAAAKKGHSDAYIFLLHDLAALDTTNPEEARCLDLDRRIPLVDPLSSLEIGSPLLSEEEEAFYQHKIGLLRQKVDNLQKEAWSIEVGQEQKDYANLFYRSTNVLAKKPFYVNRPKLGIEGYSNFKSYVTELQNIPLTTEKLRRIEIFLLDFDSGTNSPIVNEVGYCLRENLLKLRTKEIEADRLSAEIRIEGGLIPKTLFQKQSKLLCMKEHLKVMIDVYQQSYLKNRQTKTGRFFGYSKEDYTRKENLWEQLKNDKIPIKEQIGILTKEKPLLKGETSICAANRILRYLENMSRLEREILLETLQMITVAPETTASAATATAAIPSTASSATTATAAIPSTASSATTATAAIPSTASSATTATAAIPSTTSSATTATAAIPSASSFSATAAATPSPTSSSSSSAADERERKRLGRT